MTAARVLPKERAVPVVRGVMRSAALLGMAALAASWSTDETAAGAKAFLLGLACLLVLVAMWGIVETRRELRRLAAHRSSAAGPRTRDAEHSGH